MKRVCIFLGVLAVTSTLLAQSKMQQVISSAGGFKTAPGGSYYIGWTLGETLVNTWKSADGSLTISSGLQQKVMLTAIELTPGWEVEIKLYPNPVGTILTIQLRDPAETTFSVYLLDLNGSIVLTDKIEESTLDKQINMEEFPSGIYYLRLTDGLKSNTYKVVKL